MGLLEYIKANTPRATRPVASPGTVINQGLLNPNQFNAPSANRFKDSLLGLAGIIPGAGDYASGVQAADLWNRGEKLGAFASGLGALPVIPALGGMISPGAGFLGKKLPTPEKLARVKNKFIYHSGVADDVENMKYGIEPTNTGEWITEIAQGASDDVDELLEQTTPLSWFSDEPSWVAMKVARKLRKNLSDVTDEDIIKHGHVAMIPRKGDHSGDIWQIGNEGLQEGPYTKISNLKGETLSASQTPLYGETRDYLPMEPFGVEKNEMVSTKSIEPMFQLTGNELLEFLRRTGQRGLLGQ